MWWFQTGNLKKIGNGLIGDYFYLSPYDHKQLKLPFNLTKEYIVKSANFFQKSYMAEIGEGVPPL